MGSIKRLITSRGRKTEPNVKVQRLDCEQLVTLYFNVSFLPQYIGEEKLTNESFPHLCLSVASSK